MLGIAKAYTTRVGGGPFPTELKDEIGEHLGKKGHEFGATTGRARRCGWLDMVALRRACMLNGTSGLCVTKLDVLDEMPLIRLCVGYRRDGKTVEQVCWDTDSMRAYQPVYEDHEGWQSDTSQITEYDQLPPAAQRYLARVSELCEVPVDMVSTGSDRSQLIVVRHPFRSA